MPARLVLAILTLLAAPALMHRAAAATTRVEPSAISGAALVKSLQGFSNAWADVNGVTCTM